MINYLYKQRKVVNKLNKKAQKIVVWIMLLIMVGSVIAGIVAYLI